VQIAYSGEISTSCIRVSENTQYTFFGNTLSPKWPVLPGRNPTSCFKTHGIAFGTLQTCFSSCSHGLAQSQIQNAEHPKIFHTMVTMSPPKWPTVVLLTYSPHAVLNISWCHNSNLRSRLHWVSNISGWISYLMWRRIRRCCCHNLWPFATPKCHISLAENPPHASKYPDNSSAMMNMPLLVQSRRMVRNQTLPLEFPKIFHWQATRHTPKWSAWFVWLFASYPSSILRCLSGNLLQWLHEENNMLLRKPWCVKKTSEDALSTTHGHTFHRSKLYDLAG